MSKILVIGGNFRAGRLVIQNPLSLSSNAGREDIEVAKIRSIVLITKEKRSTIQDRLGSIAAGSIVGGVAAGAIAGGLTGPAGAILGAAAGAVLAAQSKFYTYRVEFADGRYFLATGSKSAWENLKALASI